MGSNRQGMSRRAGGDSLWAPRPLGPVGVKAVRPTDSPSPSPRGFPALWYNSRARQSVPGEAISSSVGHSRIPGMFASGMLSCLASRTHVQGG